MEKGIHHSPWREVHPRPGETLSSLVLGRAAEHGNKIAFVDSESGESITFAEFVGAVRCGSHGLIQHGVCKGDVVCVILPNSIHYPAVFHAILRTGAIATTCNPNFKKEEVLHQYRTAGARFLVTSSELAESIDAMFKDDPQLKPQAMFVLGESTLGISWLSLLNTDAPSWPDVELRPDDIAMMPFSSGTSGVAKAVIQTHKSLVYSTFQMMSPEVDFVRQDDVLLDVLFMFHVFGIISFLKTSIVSGSKVIVMKKYEMKPLLENIQKYKVTRLMVVRHVVVNLAKDPLVREYDLSSLHTIICGQAPLSSAIEKRLPQVKVRSLYGMTEVNVAVLMPVNEQRQGAAGKPVPNTIFQVVDTETGAACAPGVAGELLLKCPQSFSGYYKNEEATAATITQEGWIRTGDLVKVDEDGFIYIIDRCKELIKCKDFQVPPAELEALLQKHGDVAEVAVIGVPDEESFEIPKAFIVRVPGSKITEREIIDFVAENISPEKKVQLVEFVPFIAKTASGKALRRLLREK